MCGAGRHGADDGRGLPRPLADSAGRQRARPPILPVLVASGFLIGLLAVVPELARVAAIPIAGLVAYIEQVGYVLARVPLAAIDIPRFPPWLGLAYFSALGPAIAGANSHGKRRKLSFAVAAAAPVLIASAALGAWANSPAQAVVMNVGDGQAVLLRGPDGAILVDGGPSPERLRSELGGQLPPWQRRLDAIVITAAGLGHVGGLAGFDRSAPLLLLPRSIPAGSAWRGIALEQVARGASIRFAEAGQAVRLAGFELEVLAPEPGAPGDEAGAANLALRAVGPGGRSFCDFSELDLDAQAVVAQRLRGACAYVLVPSGGRSRLSPDLERVAIDRSTQLVVSRGPGRLAAGLPPDVLRTDEEGTITLPL